MQQNPDISFNELIRGDNFKPTLPSKNSDVDGDNEFAEFTL
jgi:hypothetical protein